MLKKICLLLLTPLLLHAAPSSTEQTHETMRVMTYNIRRDGKEKQESRLWKNRKDKVINLIKRYAPHIIGMQEPTKDQIKQLKKALPSYQGCGTSRGASWWGLGTDEATPIFFDTHRYILLDQDTFSINDAKGTHTFMPWKTGWLPRICTWVKLKDKTTDQTFYMYNTHLDHMYEDAQVLGAQRIIAHIKKHTGSDPVIITGDFNTAFEGRVAQVCANFDHVKHIADSIEGPEKTATGWNEETENTWIDHILIRKNNAQVNRYMVIDHETDTYPSDHRPVISDIALNA